MLRLTGTVKLQVVLSGAATASRVTVSYMDFTATATTGGTQLSVTNGATPVDICDAPAASTTRQVDHVRLVALAAMTATFSVNDGTARDWIKVTLALGDTFDWSHSGGVKVVDANGNTKTVVSGAISATTLAVSGDTTLTGDLAVNGGDLTTSATTFNLLAANATTVNAFGAASVALNIGHASAAAAFAGGISIPTGKSVTGAGTATISGFASATVTGTVPALTATTYDNTTASFAKFEANAQTFGAGADILMVAHAAARTATRYGITLGGWGELQASGGTTIGLMIGTGSQNIPIVFGTNNVEVARMTATSVTFASLAGAGTRNVVVDANGVMSAP